MDRGDWTEKYDMERVTGEVHQRERVTRGRGMVRNGKSVGRNDGKWR